MRPDRGLGRCWFVTLDGGSVANRLCSWTACHVGLPWRCGWVGVLDDSIHGFVLGRSETARSRTMVAVLAFAGLLAAAARS